jgi:AbrB family looped-hinge helix DNA binding protein
MAMKNVEAIMELVKLGKKGQITIPKNVLRQVGIREASPMLVSSTPDGGILLRPAGVYPIEIYTDERIREFEEANEVSPRLLKQVDKLIAKQRRKKPGK